jgi:hypothetical protein
MYTKIYIHTVYVHACEQIYTYIHTCIYMYTKTYIQCMYIHVYKDLHTHSVCIYMYNHIYIYIYIYTYIHTVYDCALEESTVQQYGVKGAWYDKFEHIFDEVLTEMIARIQTCVNVRVYIYKFEHIFEEVLMRHTEMIARIQTCVNVRVYKHVDSRMYVSECVCVYVCVCVRVYIYIYLYMLRKQSYCETCLFDVRCDVHVNT